MDSLLAEVAEAEDRHEQSADVGGLLGDGTSNSRTDGTASEASMATTPPPGKRARLQRGRSSSSLGGSQSLSSPAVKHEIREYDALMTVKDEVP